ncbi:hypothetical protein DS2_16559 [Catenovulum agarivorans DS-2]|uniref:Uncharacterized protein n=1 Tax=Catenovulum agarivorans DS-2 TaxID=1328313 RepID=W7Q9D9_9ALTE|nr:tetratricopeptide repeat protein [Catenovulum agarivorans]EWH08576.1 hypothetical protein DS2_16559 [Catenovulum agarivorans DS-2]
MNIKIALLLSTLIVLTSCGWNKTAHQAIIDIEELTQEQQFRQAEIEVKNALQKYTDNPEIRVAAGKFYYQIGLFLQSARFLKPVLAKQPQVESEVDAYLESLLQNRQLADLSDALKKVDNPNLRQAYLTRKALYSNDIPLASKEFIKITANNNDWFLVTNYELLLETQPNKTKQILNTLSEQTKHSNADRRLVILHARKLADSGKKEQALQKFLTVYTQSPKYPNIHVYIVQLALQLDKTAIAKAHTQQLVITNDKRPIVNQFVATLAYQQQDYKSALHSANKALQTGLDTKSLRTVAGMSAYHLEQYQLAFKLLSPLAPKLAGNDPILRILTILELKNDGHQKAIELYKQLEFASQEDITLASYLINEVDELEKQHITDISQQKLENYINNQKYHHFYISIVKSFPQASGSDLKDSFSVIKWLQNDKVELAKDRVDAWLQNHPDSEIAKTMQALIAWKTGRQTAADEIFDSLLTDGTTNHIALNYKIFLAKSQQNWQEMLTYSSQLLTLDPNNPGAFNAFLVAWQNSPKINWQTIKEQVTSTTNPDIKMPYLKLLYKHKQWLLLEQELSKITLEHRKIDHWKLYFLVNQQQNNQTQIEEIAKQFSAHPQANSIDGIQLRLLMLRHLKQTSQAVELLKHALSVFPNNVNFQLELANLYIVDNKINKAKQQLKSYSNAVKPNAHYFELIGNIAAIEKRYSDAANAYQNAFKLSANKQLIYKFHRLTSYINIQTQLLEITIEYLKHYPQEIGLRIDAFMWFADTHTDQALQIVDVPSVHKLAQTNWQLSNNLAWYLNKQGNVDKAKHFIDMAYELSPAEQSVLSTRTKIYGK